MLSLVLWMENFQQEVSSAGQSSPKEVWLLVYSCVRRFFQRLKKVRVSAAASSDDPVVQAGACLWAKAQSHRVCQEFYFCSMAFTLFDSGNRKLSRL